MIISLKVFELNAIEQSLHQDRAEKIDNFIQAVQEDGFVALKVDGLEAVIEKGYQFAKRYFALSADEKEKDLFAFAKGGGYQPLARENIANLEATADHQTEFKESLILLGKKINLPGATPEEIQALDAFREKMENVANRVLRLFHEHFSISEDEKTYFDDKSTHAALRLTHYPPMEKAPPNSIWCGSHSDISPFALLPKATASGLQLQKRSDRSWVTVDVPENTIILNTGRFLEFTTADLIQSAPHRVVSTNPKEERQSIIYFPAWSPDYVVKPWKECVEKATHSMNDEEKKAFMDNLLTGKVDRLFVLFASLARSIVPTDEQVLELAKEFPHCARIKKEWPALFPKN